MFKSEFKMIKYYLIVTYSKLKIKINLELLNVLEIIPKLNAKLKQSLLLTILLYNKKI